MHKASESKLQCMADARMYSIIGAYLDEKRLNDEIYYACGGINTHV